MKRILTILVLLTSAHLTPVLSASLVTEIVPLRFRTLEEIVPVLRPLVPPPGTLTGIQSQLVIRTTPENLGEIKTLLTTLDTAPRRLLISVKHERLETLRRNGAEVTGSYGAGDVIVSSGRRYSAGPGLNLSVGDEHGRRAGARLYQDDQSGSHTGVHQVQALEGREAYIRTGTWVPFGERTIVAGPGTTRIREGVRYRDITTGFYALPRVNGNRVTVDISTQSMRMYPAGGANANVEEASTRVSGHLGEWIQVGGATDETDNRRTGTIYSTNRAGDSRQLILLKVDELP